MGATAASALAAANAAVGTKPVPTKAVSVVVGRARIATVAATKVRALLGVEAGIHPISAVSRSMVSAVRAVVDTAANGSLVAEDSACATQTRLLVPMARIAARLPRSSASYAKCVVLEALASAAGSSSVTTSSITGLRCVTTSAAVDRIHGLVSARAVSDPC